MSGSTAITSATTKFYIGSTLPATYDVAGYTAAGITWTAVAEITNLGTFGGKSAIIKHIPLDTATVVKRAGSVDYGTINVQLAKHSGADMTALNTAFTTRASTSFKVTYPGTLGSDYFTGICAGIQTVVGTADAILNSTVDIELDSAVVSSAT